MLETPENEIFGVQFSNGDNDLKTRQNSPKLSKIQIRVIHGRGICISALKSGLFVQFSI
jgi:hypothetical protein